jgi:predicted nucleic-acid-binding protein
MGKKKTRKQKGKLFVPTKRLLETLRRLDKKFKNKENSEISDYVRRQMKE